MARDGTVMTLSRGLGKDLRWRGYARYNLATMMLAALLLLLWGVAYYLFSLRCASLASASRGYFSPKETCN